MDDVLKHQQRGFDVAIVGGGVIGCAMARRFTLEGARVILIEKSSDILAGASKANSAILHTGFDADTGSLELACMQSGYQEYMGIRESLNLPVLATGAMVVAWNAQDESKLSGIVQQAHANGVLNARLLSQSEVLAREPHLSKKAQAGVLVPDECVIDPWSAPLAYLQQAVEMGAQVRFGAEVKHGEFDGNAWVLVTGRGVIRATTVINCAGLFGDVLEQKLLGLSDFRMLPRKGQFVVFDKHASSLLNHIILPVPNERTKGVVLTRTIFGNLLVGPTAEEQSDREHAALDQAVLQGLMDEAIEKIPELAHVPVTATYAGLRPATDKKEYRIKHVPNRNWITVGGIRSTGLTSALGVAQYVYGLYANKHEPSFIQMPVGGQVPNLAEHLPRDWQRVGYGEMVCHCELVTRREIESVMTSPIPPVDVDGLKRRTRVGMGRCQGFYCAARLAQLMDAHQGKAPLKVADD